MKVAIVGAGAAGLVCGISLKQQDKDNKISIAVFEEKDRVGKKLLSTGNGRCNMMNMNLLPQVYSCPDFVLPTFEKYDVESNLDFFANLGLYTRCDSEGRIYPMSNQASSVLNTLRLWNDALGVKTLCGMPVTRCVKKGSKFYVGSYNEAFDCLVLACGSRASVKAQGGYSILEGFGHSTVPPTASLTKICVDEKSFAKSLKGIRCKAKLTLKENGRFLSEESGEILFADYGISGIAAMQLSAHIARKCREVPFSKFTVKADFVPNMDFDSFLLALIRLKEKGGCLKAENMLSGFLPKKLGEEILKALGFSLCVDISSFKQGELRAVAAKCKGFEFHVNALRGIDEAQVVSGGGKLTEFNSHTLESKKVKGLYCCGELLDVDALCGGYNLMWAFSSGRLCAESIINDKLKRKNEK